MKDELKDNIIKKYSEKLLHRYFKSSIGELLYDFSDELNLLESQLDEESKPIEPQKQEEVIVDINFLLCNAIRHLDNEQLKCLADAIYERIPKQPAQVSAEEWFDNHSDCYADTGRFENDGSYSEGEVIQAMTKEVFLKYASQLNTKK